ncbi:MAG TPA: HAMP domain-containing sensor histidine kinase [Ideonella sp.]|nr:HAMP domain-containing sensor histidine kinase [Ideonella sp.]
MDLSPALSWDTLLDASPEAALRQVAQAQRAARSAGDGAGDVRARLAEALVRDGDGDPAAASRFEQAEQQAEALGDALLLVSVRLAQARSLADHGHYAAALARCRLAIDSARALGATAWTRQALHASAVSLSFLGEHELAVETFEESRLLLFAAGRPAQAELAALGAGQAQAWLMRGWLLRQAGSEEPALQAFQRALTLAEEACGALVGASAGRCQPALDVLVRALLALDQAAAARQWAQRLLRVSASPRPGTLAWGMAQLTQARLALQERSDPAQTLAQLHALEALPHPRVRRGDLRLGLLRCLYETHALAGDPRAALATQQAWAQTQNRWRAALSQQHARWTADTMNALRSDAAEFVTHDLRAPLAVALGELQAVSGQQWGGTSAAVDSLQRAGHGVRRAMDIADKYLIVIRAEHLRSEDLQVFDLAELADDVCEQMAPPAGADVRLEREIEWGVRVRGDRILLMRALANLLSNAFKHAPPGSAVTVRLARQDDGVWLSVADQGAGLPLDMRARLFQRFATGAVRKGNGLGLAMVARVARLHDARIAVDSEPGHGTRVSMVLSPVPAADAAVATDRAAP